MNKINVLKPKYRTEEVLDEIKICLDKGWTGMGFKTISITNEKYKITGIISLLRFLPYFITIYSISIKFAIVYGTWEGFLTPNITFYAEK